MNRYGRLAQAHWAKWRPTELAQIPNPEEFFSNLGREVEAQIDRVAMELAGEDRAGEDYLAKLGRLRMARFDAEAQVLRETVLLPPEPGHPEADTDEDAPMWPATTEWMPMELTPDHPAYHDLDDDPGLRKMSGSPDNSQQVHPNDD